jgi:hypothetical protein
MMKAETIEVDEADDLVSELLAATNDPLRFVELAFPAIRLEAWQRQVLETIGQQLRENTQIGRWKAVQIAVASGNGIGKTALLSWIILWALVTFENTLGVVTAGTEPQIRTRLWGELSKWFVQLPEGLRGAFEMTATAIFNRQNERTWRVDGRPWSERNQEAFSGLHNFGKRVLVVFDECSMIPDPIWRATDAMLSDAETEIVWCVFGNPLRLDGRFPMCFPGGRFSGLWKSIQVDSRSVSITSKEAINEKLDYYGLNSNYARSHVLGQFPTASTTQLIPLDWVEMAAVRETWQHPADTLILGCDVASGHGEDSSVIYIRRGLDGRTHPPRKFPNLDPLQFAYRRIAAVANELTADAIFVDAGGVGEGTVAKLRELGLQVQAVYFGSKDDNPSGLVRCANKRSSMWCAMAQWLKAGAIPNDPELKAQLIGPEHSENPHGIVLERKEDMKARGLASPDIADALALTFAAPVFSQMSDLPGPGNHLVQSEYDPYSDAVMRGEPIPELKRKYIAPGYSSLRPEWNHPDWSGDDWKDAQASDALRYAKGDDDADGSGGW